MRKPRLMTPGPAPVPEDVLLELARPVIHHRSAEAKEVIKEVASGLKTVFQTRNDVMILTASGTGAMEAAAVNTVPRGGKALVLNAGWLSLLMGAELSALTSLLALQAHRGETTARFATAVAAGLLSSRELDLLTRLYGVRIWPGERVTLRGDLPC